MKYILSFAIWFASGLLTVALFLAVLFCYVFFHFHDRQRKMAHRQCYWWSDALIALNPFWKLTVRGLENIDPKKTYVVVANHQSMADIVVIYQTRLMFKWVAKESILKVPFLGWCLGLTEHIALKRGDFGSIKKVYRQAAEWLRKDMSVTFFPEGTRSRTDEMNTFQNGAFKLAIKEKRPVLPISIQGTRDAIPKGGWVFKAKVDAVLTVLPAIETAGMGGGDFGALRDKVFAQLEAV